MDAQFWISFLWFVAKFADAGLAGYSTDIECYQRVAVGKRLNRSEVSSTQTLATVRQCEQECERSSCHAFAFGVSTGGNGTCELAQSTPRADSVPEIDYDLFYKNERCLNRTTCFKRLAVGRSLVDRYVKRELFCDSLRACEEACALETAFVCEGFNFKFDKIGFDSKCQLTNVPSSKLSLTTDFNADPNFDFFEKDRDASRRCNYPWQVYRPPWASASGDWSDEGFSHPNRIPTDVGFPIHHSRPPNQGFDNRPPLNQGYDNRPPSNQGFDNRPLPNQGFDNRPPLNEYYGESGRPHLPPPPRPEQPLPDYGSNRIPQPPLPSPNWPPDNRFSDKGFDYGGGQHAWLGNGVGLPEECFVRVRSGFRLDRRAILASIAVPALYDCEYECVNQRKFVCNTFSFRYSSVPGGDNCQLSEKFYGALDTYTDIVPERDYDVYDRNPNGRQGCQPKRFWGSDCFERIKTGLKLNDDMTKFSIKVSSLSECEAACINMPYFTCRAFSYRYGPPTIGDREDNCLLTDWTITDGFNVHKDFTIDPECELYYRGSYGHGCEIGRYPERLPAGGFDRPQPPPPPPDRFRPAGYLPPSIHENEDNALPLNKPPSYLPPPDRSGPPPQLGPAYLPVKPQEGFPLDESPVRGHSYLPPFTHQRPPNEDRFPISDKPQGGEPYLPPPNNIYQPTKPGNAYLPFDRPPNELPYPTLERPNNAYLPPNDKPERGYLPSWGKYHHDQRKEDNFYRGPQYPIRKPDDNRYLPPPPRQPGVYGFGHYQSRPSDELCFIRSSTPARLLPSAVKVAMWCPSEAQCKEECTRAREKTRFKCATISYRDGQCELSDIEQRDLRLGYDYLQDKEFWMFTWDYGSPSCFYPPPPSNRPLLNDLGAYADRGAAETWAHFTVNGQPCRAGTVCTQNPEVGVWSCPVDNGDWDYCCRSGHHCGYSEGYDYPWCYVGSADKDQWRPCSDSYYPYAHSGRKQHWPVAYLHKEGPPNVTLNHKPSIVERFLSSLNRIAGQLPNLSNGPILETITIPVEPRKLADSSTAATEKGDAMEKLWLWGKSKYNLTSIPEDVSTKNATLIADTSSTTTTTTTISPLPSSSEATNSTQP